LSDKKNFNKNLIENLRKFQTDVNSLMTEFVEREKKAVAEGILSNEHLSKLNINANADEESTSESESESPESENTESIQKDNSNVESSDEPVEKRLCV
jgi:hypothetical protein